MVALKQPFHRARNQETTRHFWSRKAHLAIPLVMRKTECQFMYSLGRLSLLALTRSCPLSLLSCLCTRIHSLTTILAIYSCLLLNLYAWYSCCASIKALLQVVWIFSKCHSHPSAVVSSANLRTYRISHHRLQTPLQC